MDEDLVLAGGGQLDQPGGPVAGLAPVDQRAVAVGELAAESVLGAIGRQHGGFGAGRDGQDVGEFVAEGLGEFTRLAALGALQGLGVALEELGGFRGDDAAEQAEYVATFGAVARLAPQFLAVGEQGLLRKRARSTDQFNGGNEQVGAAGVIGLGREARGDGGQRVVRGVLGEQGDGGAAHLLGGISDRLGDDGEGVGAADAGEHVEEQGAVWRLARRGLPSGDDGLGGGAAVVGVLHGGDQALADGFMVAWRGLGHGGEHARQVGRRRQRADRGPGRLAHLTAAVFEEAEHGGEGRLVTALADDLNQLFAGGEVAHLFEVLEHEGIDVLAALQLGQGRRRRVLGGGVVDKLQQQAGVEIRAGRMIERGQFGEACRAFLALAVLVPADEGELRHQHDDEGDHDDLQGRASLLGLAGTRRGRPRRRGRFVGVGRTVPRGTVGRGDERGRVSRGEQGSGVGRGDERGRLAGCQQWSGVAHRQQRRAVRGRDQWRGERGDFHVGGFRISGFGHRDHGHRLFDDFGGGQRLVLERQFFKLGQGGGGIRRTVVGILAEQAFDPLAERGREIGAMLGQRRQRMLQVGGGDQGSVVALEGHATGECLVVNDAEGVQIRAGVDQAAGEEFRGHGVHRAGGGGVGHAAGGQRLRQAKVDDLQVEGVVHVPENEQVAGLEVAVQQARLMGGADAGQGLAHQFAEILQGQRPLAQSLFQALALEHLHDQVGALAVLAVVEHGDEVGMADAVEPARLAQQVFLAGAVGVQSLEGDVPVLRGVEGAEHRAAAAGSQGGQDLVAVVHGGGTHPIGAERIEYNVFARAGFRKSRGDR